MLVLINIWIHFFNIAAYYNQAIAESGSALSSWAFDSEPEKHAKDIAGGFMGCPTDSIADMVNCIKYEKTAADVVIAHKKYYVNIRDTNRLKNWCFIISTDCGERSCQDGIWRVLSLCSEEWTPEVYHKTSQAIPDGCHQ